MGRTIPVSDDLHDKIKEKISVIQKNHKRVIKIKDVVNVIIINNLDKVDEYLEDVKKKPPTL